MDIECGHCGKLFSDTLNSVPVLQVGAAEKKCPCCKRYLRQDLNSVKSLLLKSISIATVATIVLPLLLMFVLSMMTSQVSFGHSSFFFYQKAESLGGIILLLNFIVVFLGLSVPGIVRYSGASR